MKEELSVPPKAAHARGVLSNARIFFKIPRKFKAQMGGFDCALYEPFYLVELPASAKLNLRRDAQREHDALK